MKLQERLPDRVTVDGRSYKVNLDFRNVLNFMDVIGRDDLIDAARDWHALKCLMRRPPRNWERRAAIIRAVRDLLFPAQKGQQDGPRLTSFEQDADLIRAAFRQHYGIDLYRDKLHWVEFTGLLGALPEGSRYAEVLGIRARPMPKPTKYNAEERKWLAEAKARVAIHINDAEAARNVQAGLRMMAESLLIMAEATGSDE